MLAHDGFGIALEVFEQLVEQGFLFFWLAWSSFPPMESIVDDHLHSFIYTPHSMARNLSRSTVQVATRIAMWRTLFSYPINACKNKLVRTGPSKSLLQYRISA